MLSGYIVIISYLDSWKLTNHTLNISLTEELLKLHIS